MKTRQERKAALEKTRQYREAAPENSTTSVSTPTRVLVDALHQIIQMQPRPTPATLQLDAKFQLPSYAGQMNGETINSWIRNLSTYF